MASCSVSPPATAKSHRDEDGFNPQSEIRNCFLLSPRRGIMIRALTVKDILDEEIAKKNWREVFRMDFRDFW